MRQIEGDTYFFYQTMHRPNQAYVSGCRNQSLSVCEAWIRNIWLQGLFARKLVVCNRSFWDWWNLSSHFPYLRSHKMLSRTFRINWSPLSSRWCNCIPYCIIQCSGKLNDAWVLAPFLAMMENIVSIYCAVVSSTDSLLKLIFHSRLRMSVIKTWTRPENQDSYSLLCGRSEVFFKAQYGKPDTVLRLYILLSIMFNVFMLTKFLYATPTGHHTVFMVLETCQQNSESF